MDTISGTPSGIRKRFSKIQEAKAYIPPGVFMSRWGGQRKRFCVENISNIVFTP